ncbi:unnamed protein product [Meloidogyne enterolobii]|uniref:Uncharacterized protein n=1 Tax=Meloidogyne enterolobii TaxID=390850 RepID=A0ACB0ZD57_MELEN
MDCSAVNSVDDLNFLLLRADLKWLEPCCNIEEHLEKGFLVGHCLKLILDEVCQRSNDTFNLIKCSKILCRFSAILCEFSISLPSHHFHQLVDFCFYILDFPFCDAINFQAISILQNLLEIHRNFCCCKGFLFQNFFSIFLYFKDVFNLTDQILCSKRIFIPFCDFLLNFGQRIVGESDNSKNYSFTKQRAMLLNCLLKLHPDLRQQIFSDNFLIKIYKQMRNEPPTVQICNLIVDDICASLITSNKSEEKERLKTRLDLHLNWIKILFINEDIHSMENKLLPKLLRSPETRKWFFDEFSMFIDFSRSSAHSKRALCVLLRLAIVHLYEIQNGQTMDWKELLLRHVGEEQADKEMFDALMDKDFEKFLVSGAMDLKTPAKRQAIFCQLGKLISRIREHSKSLLKLLQNNSEADIQLKIYKEFLFWLCKLAFEFISNPDWHKKLMESLTLDSNIEINVKNVGDELSEFSLTNDENSEVNEIDDDCDEEENDEENSTPFATRISALTLISLIFNPSISLESDPFSTFLDLKHWIGKEEKQKLFYSLDDQFEACQKIALNLLNHFETIGWFKQNFYSQISDEEWLFLSVRPNMPRHQQAIKYRLQFILPRMEFKSQINFIETLLTLSENSCSNVTKANKGKENYFLEAFLDPPQLHALINALHVSLPFVKFEILDNDLLLIKRIYSLCLDVDKIISPVVYSLSPEGFMPSINDASLCVKGVKLFYYLQLGGYYNIYAQQLSRTCFRAHKSISGIISYIFIQYLTSPIFSSRFSKNDFNLFLSQIAFYFWQKLTECRHRGAFEAAYNEFTTVVCPRLWALCDEKYQIESYDKTTFFPYSPRQWLKQILDALTGKDASQKLCVTRRSAGLPHLIASLLENAPINELNDEHGLFHQTMRQLLACSERQNSELEIHCINVLRLLFMHSKFAELVLPHIECAFRLTINGSSSEIWQVRNAHTQLFAALIKRIFGTPSVERRTLHIETRCKQTSNEFFKR